MGKGGLHKYLKQAEETVALTFRITAQKKAAITKKMKKDKVKSMNALINALFDMYLEE